MNVGRDCWMLAISIFILGTTLSSLSQRNSHLLVNNILNLHIYQGYTSSNGLPHDFITRKNTLMALMTLNQGTQERQKEAIEREILEIHPSTRVVLGLAE